MKWMIASDIHGSAFYCKEMLDRFHAEKADRLLMLGDLLYHGPRNDLPKDYSPKDVIQMLNVLSDRILCIRGNCDADVDQMVLDFPILADYAVLTFDTTLIYATHGHIFNASNMLPLQHGDILLHGHTHIPLFESVEKSLCLTCGSVAIPKADSPHSYMTFEKGIFLWKDLQGNQFMEYQI